MKSNLYLVGVCLLVSFLMIPNPGVALDEAAVEPTRGVISEFLESSGLKIGFSNEGSILSAVVKTSTFTEEILDHSFFFSQQFENLQKPLTLEDSDLRSGFYFHRSIDWPGLRALSEIHAEVSRPEDGALVFTVTDPEGKRLPKALSIEKTYKLSEEDPRNVDVTVVLKNLSDELLDFPDDANAFYLELGPALADNSRNPPYTIELIDSNVVSLSPEEPLTQIESKITNQPAANEVAGGKVHAIGVRNTYFVLLLRHLEGSGVFTHRNLTFFDAQRSSSNAPVVGFAPKLKYLKPNAEETFRFRLYLGPKTAEHLGKDYAAIFDNWTGFTGPIGYLMFLTLNFFFEITRSYGWAIFLLTVFVKLLLLPLSKVQTTNMQKMAKLQPKMQELRDKHKDPTELNQKMLELYREHQVNPAGGCLPMLVQIPVFIALYTCLQGAIELKNVSFWWLTDLSTPDPYLILPVGFCLSIYFTSKAMQPPDAGGAAGGQAAMMRWFMPLMMFAIMKQVSGGVMIYLCGQSVMGVFEQKFIKEGTGWIKDAFSLKKSTIPKNDLEENKLS